MSTTKLVCETLLEATEPMRTAEIAEACGADSNNVSQALFALVAAGAVERLVNHEGSKHAYQVADEAECRKRAGRGNTEAVAGEDESVESPRTRSENRKSPSKRAKKAAVKPERKTGRPRKVKTKTKRALVVAPIPAPGHPRLSFAIGENGQLLIVRADGAGESATIGRDDALRLQAFLNRAKPMLLGST